jgi:hypothetical protein
MASVEKAPRSFAVFLANLADGDANRELSEEWKKLSDELQKDSSNRNAVSKGKLNLKLSLQVDPRGVCTIGWDVETREPKPPRVGGVMWIDANGNMVHENPRQQKLPLREVGGREPGDVFDPDTGEVRRAKDI